jgi:hypothetical protein
VNARLMHDLADALADKDIHRELTQGALAMAHAARLDAERERTQRLALIDELREFRRMTRAQSPITVMWGTVGKGFWSGLRESNPSSWLGKPEHYHYAKPALGGNYTIADFELRIAD